MMDLFTKLLLIPVLVQASGCAGLISQPRQDVPVEEAGVTGSSTAAAGTSGADDIMAIEALESEDSLATTNDLGLGRPAVLALLETAEQDKRTGKVELAAANLERALRMEPKNPVLWSRLAEIRLIQRSWQQAYILANKSNSLAQDNRALQIQNWRIIEQARSAQGDMPGLDQARSRLRELQGSNP